MNRQIVSVSEMKQMEQLTIKKLGLTMYELTRKVGRACGQYLFNINVTDISGKYTVISGSGHNGLDSVFVFKWLKEHNIDASLFIVNTKSDISSDLKMSLKNIEYTSITTLEELHILYNTLYNSSTIIDGLFGTGLNRPISGLYKTVIELINDSYAKVISIDIPSGIHAESGTVMGIAVYADHTLAIQNLKQGHLLNYGFEYSGILHTVDCGFLQDHTIHPTLLLEQEYLYKKIPKRRSNTHKYQYGNVMTIGGSIGMMGAPILAAQAALKMGSGLSQVLHHKNYYNQAFLIDPNLLMKQFNDVSEIPYLITKVDSIVFGPGLGKTDDYNLNVLEFCLQSKKPIVIDADGIHYFKKLKDQKNQTIQYGDIIMTPHHKEMADFLNIEVSELQKNLEEYTKKIAQDYGIVVVLKGACTIISDGTNTFYSILGNPGMATAGSGDVLSGILGNLLARKYDKLLASNLGVIFHSSAGEIAKELHGEESMCATDLIKAIPEVMRYAKH
jgi:NAD(P)H-hydrate epimerase